MRKDMYGQTIQSQEKKPKGKRQMRKEPRMTLTRMIGILGSLATIIALGWTIATSADNGSQKADVRAGDNNQINISQTEDGDIINHFEKTGSVSRSADPLEDLPEEPCPQWLARAYDLVREGRQTGEFDEAKLVIGKMLEAKGMDLQSRCILQYNLGLAYYFSGEIGSAQWAFQEAVKGGGFPYAYYCLGLTYVAEESEKTTKDYTKAIDAFTRAIEGEENSEYYRARAQAYKKSGDLEAAAQDMKMMYRLLAAEQQS